MSARRGATLALLVGSVSVVLAAGACSDKATTLDRTATERAVEEVIGGRLDDVERVRCPDEISRGAGKQFPYDAVLEPDSAEVRLRVRQVDADGKLEVQLRTCGLGTLFWYLWRHEFEASSSARSRQRGHQTRLKQREDSGPGATQRQTPSAARRVWSVQRRQSGRATRLTTWRIPPSWMV